MGCVELSSTHIFITAESELGLVPKLLCVSGDPFLEQSKFLIFCRGILQINNKMLL